MESLVAVILVTAGIVIVVQFLFYGRGMPYNFIVYYNKPLSS